MNVVTLIVIAFLAAGTEAGGPEGREVEQHHELIDKTLMECEVMARKINLESNDGPHKFIAWCTESK